MGAEITPPNKRTAADEGGKKRKRSKGEREGGEKEGR